MRPARRILDLVRRALLAAFAGGAVALAVLALIGGPR